MFPNIFTLMLNGLTLSLAIGLLTLILWQDSKSGANRYFGLLLFMVVIWSSGSLLARAAVFTRAGDVLIQAGLRLLDIGFTGTVVSLYIYCAVITGARGTTFRYTALLGLGVVFAYQVLMLFSSTHRSFGISDDELLLYYFDLPSILFYLAFQISTVILVKSNWRKIRDYTLVVGILLFTFGQILGLLNFRLRMLGVAEDIGALAILVMSFSVVRQQIMTPLLGRAKQLEIVRDLGLAVTRRLNLQETLSTLAAQAADLLRAEGVAIFLKQGDLLKLAAVYNLPIQFVGIDLPIGRGLAGAVAVEKRARRVDHYRREWKGEADMPLARETFGAVVGMPLMFADEVVGVLLAIQGRQGRLFNRDDLYLLELLGPQAAVAITNSRLFEAEQDLTRELSEAKGQLETVLTSTKNPVVAINRKFRIIFANPAAAALVNKPDINPVGQPLIDLVPAHFLPANPYQTLRKLRNQHTFTYEMTAHDRMYLCQVAELGQQRPEGWVVILNDITQLKELDTLKSQMIQMASHDLKNPLQAAMSYLELLQEDGEDIFTEDMRNYTNVVWTQLTRMFRIINSILNLERVQAGKPAPEICELDTILHRVVDDMINQAEIKGLDLKLRIGGRLPAVEGDEQQLGQAFTNLVENAIKFTPSGGCITVRAEANQKDVLIRVVDTGIGISPEEQGRVFERFYRGRHHGMEHASGSGLGLSLVKAVIDSHKGSIVLESEPGQGTTFFVRLPVLAEGDK
jgi:signal transduction histidine kinase